CDELRENALAQQAARTINEIEQYGREDSKHQSTERARPQSRFHPGAQGFERLRRRAWFSHVHHNQDAQVIESGDRAVEQAEDRKPDEVRIESGAEDVELAEESGGQRHTDQRHQEDGEQPRRERLLPGESREVADVYIFLALPREMR